MTRFNREFKRCLQPRLLSSSDLKEYALHSSLYECASGHSRHLPRMAARSSRPFSSSTLRNSVIGAHKLKCLDDFC
jgi:hypothetical protein